MEKTESNLKAQPAMILADAGYASEETLRELETRGLPACVALGREGKRDAVVNAEKYPAKARMAEQLKTPEGQAHYRRRKVIPEPVFGWIKQALGFRRFSMRGLKKVKGEWDLICLAVNFEADSNPADLHLGCGVTSKAEALDSPSGLFKDCFWRRPSPSLGPFTTFHGTRSSVAPATVHRPFPFLTGAQAPSRTLSGDLARSPRRGAVLGDPSPRFARLTRRIEH